MSNRPVLAIIFLTVFIDLLGFGLILPLLPMWADRLTASTYLIISLGSAYSLAQFIFAPIWGRLSDKLGRRPVILTSLLGGGLAYLMMAFADSLAMLYAARILQGLFTAGGLAAAPALIADITTPEERPRGMGLIGAAFGLGFVFGPAFGGFLVTYGMAVPFKAAAVLSLMNFVWAWFMLPETLTRRKDVKREEVHFFDFGKLMEAFGNPQLAFLLMILFINTFAFSNLEQTFTLFVHRHFSLEGQEASRLTAYILAYIGIIAVIVQGGMIRPLTKRFGEVRLLISGILMTGVGMIIVPYPASVIGLLGACTLISVGWGLVNPCTSSLISKAAAADRQGGVLGLSQGLASLARVVGPQWGGWMFSSFGIAWPYWTGGFILLVSFVFASLWLNPGRKAQESVVQEEMKS